MKDTEALETELVPQSVSVIRAETETQTSIARMYPRDIKQAVQRALAEIDDKDFATTLYYSIPRRKRQSDGSYKNIFIEGDSIRCAMLAVRHYGNCAAAARIEQESDNSVDVIGMFHDFETNTHIRRPVRVSKWIKYRDGRVELLPLDQLHQNIQGHVSRAMRNAVLDGLPATMRRQISTQARLIAVGTQAKKWKPDVDAICAAFSMFNIDRQRIESFLGKTLEKLTLEDNINLRGTITALKDGQIKPAEAFVTDEPPAAVEMPPDMTATVTEDPPPVDGTPSSEPIERVPDEGPMDGKCSEHAWKDGKCELCTEVMPDVTVADKIARIESSSMLNQVGKRAAIKAAREAGAPPKPPKQKTPEEKEMETVGDLLTSIAKARGTEFDEWPGANTRILLALSKDAREAVIDAWKRREKEAHKK